jgi:hypothetical protein
VRRRQVPPVLLHLLGAEQLGAQGRFIGHVATAEDAVAQLRHPRNQGFPDRPTHCLHAQLQQVPGHQRVRNENGSLHRKRFLVSAMSINLKYLLHQIEGKSRRWI